MSSEKQRKSSTGNPPVRKLSSSKSPASSAVKKPPTRRMTVAGNAPTLAQLKATDGDNLSTRPGRRSGASANSPDFGKLQIVEENESPNTNVRSRRMTVTGPAPNPALLRQADTLTETPRGGTRRQDVVGSFLKEKGIDKHLLHNKDVFMKKYIHQLDQEVERDRKKSLRDAEDEKKMRKKLAKDAEENAKVREHASLTMYANLSPEARRAALSEAEEELYDKLVSRFPRAKDQLMAPATIEQASMNVEELTVRLVKARDVINRMLDSEDVDQNDINIAIEAYNGIQEED